VLWHTEVEDESPAEIAPLLGLRPNGVAALAYRAREGLRQAYLRAHLPEVERSECRATVSKLAGWVRSSVPDPLSRKISKHLSRCADCRARADTLTTVNSELRSSVAPLLLGASLAAAYLPAAAPATVAKTLVAKAAAIFLIAATAVTTVASSPNVAGCDPRSHAPGLADTTSTAETVIQGPIPSARPPVSSPGSVPSAGSSGSTPADGEVPASSSVPSTTSKGLPPAANDNAEEAISANEERKAEKEADKQARKEAKEQAKAEREAEKDKGKGK
jgi:hypothetical protein